MSLRARIVQLALALGLLWAPPVLGQPLGTPSGQTILTISGAIENTNVGDTAEFDLALLESLPSVTFETTTMWTDGQQTFTGVLLITLMETVGARGEGLTAAAINDYAVDIPRSDWTEGGPIVAYLNNGEHMSIRDKGPLWVIYPYDSAPDYQTEVIYSRSIWQLDRIVVDD